MGTDKLKFKEFINKINTEVPIYDLVQENNVILKKVGKNFMGLCPFHSEKNASFSVSPEKNIAVCMSCKKGGRPISFYKEIKKVSFQYAVSELAQRLNIVDLSKKIFLSNSNNHLYRIIEETMIFFQSNLYDRTFGKKAFKYLEEERKIKDETIKYFKLGYALSHLEENIFNNKIKNKKEFNNFSSLVDYLKKNFSINDLIDLGIIKENEKTGDYYNFFNERLIFPITDHYGKFVGFAGRNLNNNEPIKYLFNTNTKLFNKQELLYQFYENKSEIIKKNQVIIYEGFFEVIVSFQCGIKNTVATMGTNLSIKQIKILSELTKEFIFAYDNDFAGQESFFKLGNYLTKEGFRVKRILFPNGQDPDEYYRQKGTIQFQKFIIDNTEDFLDIKCEELSKKINYFSLDTVEKEKIKSELFSLFYKQNEKIKIHYQSILNNKYNIKIKLFFDKNNNIQKSADIYKVKQLMTTNFLLDVIFDRHYLYINWDRLSKDEKFSNFQQKSPDVLSINDLIYYYYVFLFKEIKKYYDSHPQENSITIKNIDDFFKLYPQASCFIIDLKNKIKIKEINNSIYKYKLKMKNEKKENKKKEILNKVLKLQLQLNNFKLYKD
ncbi:DNA primase [Candidatus Phytoplasma mali]|uniref:DNA primase n=1 Tax=Phytoplasma mali (strain AT) TaxID=482235 RepID=B3QZV5_PHYMT|nr:DNA primase [Candidatus Phytoplasma mali]CAP18492.1 DNA primase [Candidatus Phytoplasma mali]